jgi:TetR/AcrR family transcriptional regulator, transcriptional repressor for nem operon
MMHIMRYPESHKAEVRERIVRAAAVALRREGLAGVSIPALMKEVGLTHGGFYGHFRDRDALVAEAVAWAAAETSDGVFSDERSLEEALELYLSEGHVTHPEQGCVVAALGSEGVHQPAPVKKAFSGVARGLLSLVQRKLHPRTTTRAPTDDALRLAATMVGAVVLARLVDDPSLARRLLAAARASHAT